MSTPEELKRTQHLRLENVVVVRKVPMTEHGCNMLRAIRDYQNEQLREQEGLEVELQYPTVIHMLMTDYCAVRGIQVDNSSKTS